MPFWALIKALIWFRQVALRFVYEADACQDLVYVIEIRTRIQEAVQTLVMVDVILVDHFHRSMGDSTSFEAGLLIAISTAFFVLIGSQAWLIHLRDVTRGTSTDAHPTFFTILFRFFLKTAWKKIANHIILVQARKVSQKNAEDAKVLYGPKVFQCFNFWVDQIIVAIDIFNVFG